MLRRRNDHIAGEVTLGRRPRAEQSPSAADGLEVETRHVRSRRAQTPGELALHNDVAALRAAQDRYVQGVTFDYADHEGGAMLIITYLSDSGSVCPNRFQLRVKKYYPHNKPELTCLDSGFTCSHISPAGEVMHMRLRDPLWSAVNGLREIVSCLQEIRQTWTGEVGPMGAMWGPEGEGEGGGEGQQDSSYSGGMLTNFGSGSAFLPYRSSQSRAGEDAKKVWRADQDRARFLINIGEVEEVDAMDRSGSNGSQMFQPHPPTPNVDSTADFNEPQLAGSQLSADGKAAGDDMAFSSLFPQGHTQGRLVFPLLGEMHVDRLGAASTSTDGAICDGEENGIYGEYDEQGTDEEGGKDSEDDMEIGTGEEAAHEP